MANCPDNLEQPPGSLAWLVEIMQRLLGPDGCPWDREQTLETLRPYLVEECYEVLEAIDTGDREHHCEELGDLLLQIVFQAALAEIGMHEVVGAIGQKLIRRHPHVFGDVSVRNSADVVANWETIKATEKAEKNVGAHSVVDSVPRALPALHRAHQLTHKATKAGFRGGDPRQALDASIGRLDRQIEEDSDNDTEHSDSSTEQLVGDALLHLATWSRALGVEPEQALRDALRRFEQQVQSFEETNAGPTTKT